MKMTSRMTIPPQAITGRRFQRELRNTDGQSSRSESESHKEGVKFS